MLRNGPYWLSENIIIIIIIIIIDVSKITLNMLLLIIGCIDVYCTKNKQFFFQ